MQAIFFILNFLSAAYILTKKFLMLLCSLLIPTRIKQRQGKWSLKKLIGDGMKFYNGMCLCSRYDFWPGLWIEIKYRFEFRSRPTSNFDSNSDVLKISIRIFFCSNFLKNIDLKAISVRIRIFLKLIWIFFYSYFFRKFWFAFLLIEFFKKL